MITATRIIGTLMAGVIGVSLLSAPASALNKKVPTPKMKILSLNPYGAFLEETAVFQFVHFEYGWFGFLRSVLLPDGDRCVGG